jgi:hypothetical protein
MRYSQPGSIDGYNITVTSTATSLLDLIESATGVALDISRIDSVRITPEDGDIRYTYDQNIPTAAKGMPLVQGGIETIQGVSPSNIQLIRSGGSDVTVAVVIGFLNYN